MYGKLFMEILRRTVTSKRKADDIEMIEKLGIGALPIERGRSREKYPAF